MIYITDPAGKKLSVSANGVNGCKIEPRANEVELAKSFLLTCKPTKTTFVSSYGLKHAAEEWAGEYISNGALITAAIEMGLGTKYLPHYGPNVGIAVSKNIFKQKERR